MTEEQIKVAVAEELGWRQTSGPSGKTEWWHGDRIGWRGKPPDYVNSRDACAEFELGMTTREFFDYAHELRTAIIGRYTPNPEWTKSILSSSMLAITATALQRCEAFLRVKGKWRD